MNDSPSGHQDWIRLLLARLDLVKEAAPIVDPSSYWVQLENSNLSERMGKVVADINQIAGYQVLEMLEFLPPQETALRVTFTRRSYRHHMELILRDSGIYLVFSTSKRGIATLDKYFPSFASRPSCTIAWERIIQPSETPDMDIQAWLSYLLSGLDRSFRPDLAASQSSEMTEVALNGRLRKVTSA